MNPVETTSIAVGTLAVAPLTWWLTRPLLLTDDPEAADSLFEPLDIPGGVRAAIGVMSVLLVANGLRALVVGLGSGDLRRDWLGIVVPSAILAGYAGFVYAMATAPTVGTNAGAGLLLLGLFVVVPTLATISLVYGQRLRPPRTPRRPPRLPSTP